MRSTRHTATGSGSPAASATGSGSPTATEPGKPPYASSTAPGRRPPPAKALAARRASACRATASPAASGNSIASNIANCRERERRARQPAPPAARARPAPAAPNATTGTSMVTTTAVVQLRRPHARRAAAAARCTPRTGARPSTKRQRTPPPPAPRAPATRSPPIAPWPPGPAPATQRRHRRGSSPLDQHAAAPRPPRSAWCRPGIGLVVVVVVRVVGHQLERGDRHLAQSDRATQSIGVPPGRGRDRGAEPVEDEAPHEEQRAARTRRPRDRAPSLAHRGCSLAWPAVARGTDRNRKGGSCGRSRRKSGAATLNTGTPSRVRPSSNPKWACPWNTAVTPPGGLSGSSSRLQPRNGRTSIGSPAHRPLHGE